MRPSLIRDCSAWNTGAARTAIVDFVRRVTTAGGPGFVPPPERIAVFDNDGRLRAEQPICFLFAVALDRVKELLPSHPPTRCMNRCWKCSGICARKLARGLDEAPARGWIAIDMRKESRAI